MKKLLLAAGLSVVALVVAPIASASAEHFIGACSIHGTAEFKGGPHGNGRIAPTSEPNPYTGMEYEFASGGSPETVCVHLGKGRAEKLAEALKGANQEAAVKEVKEAVAEGQQKKARAQVDGVGALGCDTSHSEGAGDGEIELTESATKSEFTNFEFTGVLSEVTFTAGEPAAGHASFARDTTHATECSNSNSVGGPKLLEFDAVTAGVV